MLLIVGFLTLEPALLTDATGQGHEGCPVHAGLAGLSADAPSLAIVVPDGPVKDPAAGRLLSRSDSIFVPPRL